MKILKVIARSFAYLLLIATIIVANNATIQSHISTIINNLI